MIGEISGKILSRLGYRVDTCTDPSQALFLFEEDLARFDMVTTDMSMPGMPGIQLVAWIRQIDSMLPVILYTGTSERLSKEKTTILAIGEVFDSRCC